MRLPLLSILIDGVLLSNVRSFTQSASLSSSRCKRRPPPPSLSPSPSWKASLFDIGDGPPRASPQSIGASEEPQQQRVARRSFIRHIATTYSSLVLAPLPAPAQPLTDSRDDTERAPFRSGAHGREEYTNSLVASRDTNISPKEVYDTIASDYLKEAFDAAMAKGRGGNNNYHGSPRALDVGAGAGVSTEVLYNLGYHEIDALDWSGAAWEKYVVEDPDGHCPPGVTFYPLDDERYLDKWRDRRSSQQSKGGTNDVDDDGLLFDVIVFNFAVNESKAKLFAEELLNKHHGRLLAPINTSNDYWLKQTYKVMDSRGEVLWSAIDVGAWSVQFQPDVTQDTCSGIWCAPFNGFQKK